MLWGYTLLILYYVFPQKTIQQQIIIIIIIIIIHLQLHHPSNNYANKQPEHSSILQSMVVSGSLNRWYIGDI